MRILAIILLIAGGLLLVPEIRMLIPRVQFDPAVWQWISFGSIGIAVMVYFLAPKDD